MTTMTYQDDGTVLVRIDIAASPERVFRALTDPADLTAWWAIPLGCRVQEWDVELRVGGQWRMSGRGTNGEPVEAGGEFLLVDAPHRLVFRWRPNWESGPDTVVSYHLEPIGAGTRVTLQHQRRSSLAVPPTSQSYRKARIGSTREARRAGR